MNIGQVIYVNDSMFQVYRAIERVRWQMENELFQNEVNILKEILLKK